MPTLRDAIYQEAETLPLDAQRELLAMAIRMLAARGAATQEQLTILEQLDPQRTQMDTAIQMFRFDNKQEIRVIEGNDGEPWFVAKDICDALGLGQVSRALDRLDADQRGLLRVPHPQNPTTTLAMSSVNESGMYELVIRSDKPEAKRFRKWVTSEVLPTLRKHGTYVVPGREPDEIALFEQMLAAYKRLHSRVDELTYDVGEVRRDVSEIKAAQGKTEVQLLPAQTSDTGYRTVVGYANMRGIRITNETAKEYGHLAAEWSRKHGYPISKAPDTRFGTVNTYHIDALDWAFGNGN